MYKVKKTLEVSASHALEFAGGVREPVHGHNWKIVIYCRSEELDADGMVVNFLDIERDIRDYLDHGDLNELLPVSPTTENLARWVCDHVAHCYKVEVTECESNEASYEK